MRNALAKYNYDMFMYEATGYKSKFLKRVEYFNKGYYDENTRRN